MPAKNNKLPLRDSAGRFAAKSDPVVVAPSSDTADSLRVVTQGLSALLTQIKIDRQNARRRVLTPKEKELRGERAKAALEDLKPEIKDLTDTLKKFETVDDYKKYIEEQKVKAKAEKDKTKYQDAAESKFESGDFIGGMLFKWLGRNEPRKGDLKKEEEEKQLIEEKRKLNKTLLGLQEREANLERLAGVTPTPTPTPIAPEAPAPEAAKPVAPATPAATAKKRAKPVAPATPAPEAAKPEAQIQILEEAARVKAEQTHTETQKQTTIIQRTSDGIDKLWTEPINVNATVIDFSDPALKKLVTKLKDEGIGTGGGGGGLVNNPLGTLGILALLSKAKPLISGGLRVVGTKLGVMGAGVAGEYAGNKLEDAGYTKTGKVVHGVGTIARIAAGAALGAPLGPVGMLIGGLGAAILDLDDTVKTFNDVGNLFSNAIDAFSKHPYPSFENTTTNNLMKELIPLIVKLTGLGSNKAPLEKEYNNPAVVDSVSKLIQSESGNDPKAINPATGAAGLYQFMPSTAIETARKLREETGDKSFDDLITSGGNARASGMIQNMSPEQQTKLFHKYQEPLFKKVKTARGLNAVPDYAEMKAFNFASSFDPSTPNGVLYDSTNPKGKIAIEQNRELKAIASDSGGKVTNKNLVEYFQKPENQPQLRIPTTTPNGGTPPPVESKPSPFPAPITQGAATYTRAVTNDIMKTPPQTAAPTIINTTNNLGGTSTTSSQKEARVSFLPMPNYFYNVDGTSCAC